MVDKIVAILCVLGLAVYAIGYYSPDAAAQREQALWVAQQQDAMELDRARLDLESAQQQRQLEKQAAPAKAAAWLRVQIILIYGIPAVLLFALAGAYYQFRKHVVVYRPDIAGLMPVHRDDLSEASRAALVGFHQAQIEAARRALVPTSYAPHLTYGQPAEQAAPALMAPAIEVVKPLTAWLAWADEQPHILLGGKTKAGKTTTATTILAQRLRNREQVFIIDPHSSGWMGLPTAGRASQEGELRRALGAVLSEYLHRMKAREAHKTATGQELPHTHFGRMTVLIDECNAIADELAAEWTTFTKQLASGSRKVGISLLMLAQSPLVEDLRISGAMRENFARLALDERTVQAMIDSERDKERKVALQAALVGLNYPAAAQIGAQVWLCDRQGMGEGAPPADARSLIWQGWDFTHGVRRAPPIAPSDIAPIGGAEGHAGGAAEGATEGHATQPLRGHLDAKYEHVKRLVLAKAPSSQIIAEIWGVRSGDAYTKASRELASIMADLIGGAA